MNQRSALQEELYQAILQLLRDEGFAWVAAQVEDEIAEGVIEEKEAREISAPSSATELRYFSVTKKEKLRVRRHANSDEKLAAIVLALDTLLVDLPSMAQASLSILNDEGVDSVDFGSPDGSHTLSLEAVAAVDTAMIRKVLDLLRSGQIDEG